MSRYTVWSVGRDGNMDRDQSFEIPAEALERFSFLQDFFGGLRCVGITDNESPESGDVSDKLAEEIQ